jgi:predicted GTPase
MKPNGIAQENGVHDLPLWRDKEAHDVLKKILKKHDVDEEIFARLVSAYRDHAHKQRPRGISADFDEIFQSIGE